MWDFVFGALVVIGAGTVGVMARDVWSIIRSRLMHGRRKEDIKQLTSGWQDLADEYEGLEYEKQRIAAAKKALAQGSKQ